MKLDSVRAELDSVNVLFDSVLTESSSTFTESSFMKLKRRLGAKKGGFGAMKKLLNVRLQRDERQIERKY